MNIQTGDRVLARLEGKTRDGIVTAVNGGWVTIRVIQEQGPVCHVVKIGNPFSNPRPVRESQLQVEINEWQQSTFPVRTSGGTLKHLEKEFHEFLESQSPAEAADLVLLLFQHADLNNYNLLAEVRKKFEIVQRRKWGTSDADGVYEHDRTQEDK